MRFPTAPAGDESVYLFLEFTLADWLIVAVHGAPMDRDRRDKRERARDRGCSTKGIGLSPD